MRATRNGYLLRLRLPLRVIPQCRNYSTSPAVAEVESFEESTLDIPKFRQVAFGVERPLLVKHGASGTGLPAKTRWFQARESHPSRSAANSMGLSPYLTRFSMVDLPYELIYPQPGNPSNGTAEDGIQGFLSWLSASADDTNEFLAQLLSHYIPSTVAPGTPQLLRFSAPLALFIAALEFNQTANQRPITQLYIAQASLPDLPEELQQDLPTPDTVKHAGRGDVYDSSIWLGLEPTYTPWHRDPNPNLFHQLCGRKAVRLLPPGPGEGVFRRVQAELVARGGTHAAGAGSARIRGEEMMQGPERAALHDAVWGASSSSSAQTLGGMQEARLEPGDALFIPKGWWHSVRSSCEDGRLNASVNWWFR